MEFACERRDLTMEIQDLTYRPRLVFWELTQGCNLRCIHCRASATELC